MVQACFKDSTKIYVSPIIDWEDADVWGFIEQEKVPYCSLYDEGWKRLGCVLCPIGGHPKAEAERWPKIAKAYVRTFDRLLEARALAGKTQKFETGKEMFDWWCLRHTKKGPSEDQMTLFE
jgi:phosphoadenosine phosphosulfate reductase